MRSARSTPGWLAVFCLAAGLSSAGCAIDILALPYFLFAPEPVIPPRVALLSGKKDKKKLVVLAYADSSIVFGFDAIDDDLGNHVIGEISKTEKRIEVVPERKVRAWRDTHPNWAETSLQQIGEHFDADYVMFLEVNRFSMHEAKNQFLLQGHASVLVKVHDVNKNAIILDNMYNRDYPPNRPVQVTDLSSEDIFRRAFILNMGKELAWYIVPHKPDDEPKGM